MPKHTLSLSTYSCPVCDQEHCLILICTFISKACIYPCTHLQIFRKYFSKLKLRSRVIAGAVYPEPSGILEENITISFSYDEVFFSV